MTPGATPGATPRPARSSGRRLAALLLASVLAVLSVAGALTLAAAPAYACTCAPLTTAEQAANADAVLAGTVETTTKDSDGNAAGLPQTVTLTVAADRWWKGTPRAAVEVVTAGSGAACGLGALPAGERYVVFARESNGTLYANLCDGTGPATTARLAAVEDAVGAGSAVVPGTGDDTDGGTDGGSGDDASGPTGPDPGLRPVADADPPDPVVLAAPGAVLVAGGLLGLLVVLALGRSRRRRA